MGLSFYLGVVLPHFVPRKGAKTLTSMKSHATMRALIGQVAQLVEQRTENPRVGSSILPLATKIQRPTVLGWAFSFVLPA